MKLKFFAKRTWIIISILWILLSGAYWACSEVYKNSRMTDELRDVCYSHVPDSPYHSKELCDEEDKRLRVASYRYAFNLFLGDFGFMSLAPLAVLWVLGYIYFYFFKLILPSDD